MIKFSFDFDDLDDESIIEPKALKYYDEGIAYRMKKIYDKAIVCFDKAIAVRPSFYNAYLQKFFALCELEDANSHVNNIVMITINKAIHFCATSKVSYLHMVKAEYYMRQKKYYMAVLAFRDSLSTCPFNLPVIFSLINCYKILWDIPQIIHCFEYALSNVDEHAIDMPPNANGGALGNEMSPCPSSIITRHIKGGPVQVCEVTYPFADICFEYSRFLHSIGLHSKAYFLAGKSISHSRWAQYLNHRIDLCVEMPSKLRTKHILNNFKNDYSNRKKLGGEIFENKNLYMYNLLKNSFSNPPHDVNINFVSIMFREEPLSILQWAIIQKQGHELSNLICNDICSIPDMTHFFEYQQYCILQYDKRKSLFFMGMLNYYLGGVASSFIVFDDEFDMSFDSLTSKESYFYSRIAKEMGIDFIPINSFGIAQLEHTDKTSEDYFFLGMMYLLDMNREKAIDCFRKGTSYKYSRLMLYICADVVEYKNELLMFEIFRHKKIVDINSGVEQFMDYFILRECYSFLPLSYIQNNSDCPCPMPLWESYVFQDDLKIEISNEILRIQLFEEIQKELTQISSERITKKTDKLVQEIGLNSIDDISIPKIAYLISKCYISQEDVILLSIYMYVNHSINVSEFININMYFFLHCAFEI